MSEGEAYIQSENQKDNPEEGYEEEDQYIQGRYDEQEGEYGEQEGYEGDEMYDDEEEKEGEGYEEGTIQNFKLKVFRL